VGDPPPTGPAPTDLHRQRLDRLHDAGRQLRTKLSEAPDTSSSLATLSDWERECATAISELSGGYKQHWLSRAFSQALLVPAAGVDSVSVVAIVDRVLTVIDSARRSLAGASAGAETAPPPRPRFATIENSSLRANLEYAYNDGQLALTRGESTLALMTFCSILETVLTDALERRGADRLAPYAPPQPIVDWPFATRIEVAERIGLVSRGCARLPEVARTYRGLVDAPLSTEVSPRDAKLTRAVLHVILGDLSQGR
jgi:hypothetical protein